MRKTIAPATFVFLCAIFLSATPAAAQTHNFWTTASSPLPIPTQWPATGVINGLIYVAGGWNGSALITDTQIYNPVTDSWSTGAPMPMTWCCGASAVVKGVLYVFGGSTDGATQTNAVWAYNPTTNIWSSKSPMPTTRSSNAAAVLGGTIYVIGGNSNENGFRLTTNEAYNTAKDTWKTKAPMLVGRSEPSVGTVKFLVNGVIVKRIVAADGFTPSGDTGENEIYNPSTNSWSSLPADPLPRNEACTGAVGSKLIVAAGSPEGSSASTENDVFDISSSTWTTLPSPPFAVDEAGSAVYKNRLYCFGGGDDTGLAGSVFNFVQIYHP